MFSKDELKSFELSDKENVEATYKIATNAYKNKRPGFYTDNYKLFWEAIEEGDAEAQCLQAEHWRYKLDPPKTRKGLFWPYSTKEEEIYFSNTSMYWYGLAAAQGYPKAIAILKIIASAKEGDAESQYAMGKLCMDDLYFHYPCRSMYWHELAAKQGNAKAVHAIGEISENEMIRRGAMDSPPPYERVLKGATDAVLNFRSAYELGLTEKSKKSISQLYYSCIEKKIDVNKIKPVVYHAALLCSEKDMKDRLISLAKKHPHEIAALFIKYPQDIEKIKDLLPQESAKKIAIRVTKLLKKEIFELQKAIRKHTFMCADISDVIFQYIYFKASLDLMKEVELSSKQDNRILKFKVLFFKPKEAIKKEGKVRDPGFTHI